MATHNQRDINLVIISRNPVITMWRSNYFTRLLLSVMFLPFCSSRDIITTGGTIKYPRGATLVSEGERFELGFFSPTGSFNSTWYVGIWYYRSYPLIVVWVANRDNPIVRRTASFGLVDGDLKVLNEEQVIWSTNVSSSSTRLAKLLDSGNLVLIEGQTIVWQSFEQPTDTFLPGMLMTDDFKLTSWTSQDDPKQGNFTFQWDQESNYVVVSRGMSPFWKSGVSSKFIQADEMLKVIFFLLSNSTPTPTTDKESFYRGIVRRSYYNYNNTRLVMNSDGRIQYFRPVNESKPIWYEPKGQCSKFDACGKFGSCNNENGNETMCRCLPGFQPANLDNWKSGDFSDGCLRKSSICGKNSDNNAFLSLKMMKAGRSDALILVDSEEQCRQKCLGDCKCQAYSVKEDQRRGTESGNTTCYIWLEDLDNIQEYAQDGYNLSVQVQLSDIGSTKRSCGTCGTNLVPYPLSTGRSCGDPLYSAFTCEDNGQLSFGRYRVTSVNPEDRVFTIQVKNASDCKSSSQMETNLDLNQSSPFRVRSGCIGGQNGLGAGDSSGSVWLSEVKIVWSNPKEPICNSAEDCDWPQTTCKKASDGIRRCLCNSGFRWNSLNVNCSGVVGNTFEGGASSHKTQKVKPVYIVAAAGAAIFVLVFSALFYVRRQHGSTQGSRESTQENPDFRLYDSEKRIKMWMDSGQFEEDDKKGIDVPFFDLEIILQATNNFSDENKLGRGGFGPVYKATFPGGQKIAVKRLWSGSGQGLEEFKNEVVLIAKLQHRNLVRLVGYCVEGDEKMLLYEYMPNKSLDSFIFDRTRCWLLTWEIRFEIILGIARGMLYLHQDSRLRIIHRDLKTSNVLLDEEMTPKISDFGLARIFEAKQTEASTQRVIGTYGYMSPEYALDGFFSFKSDVFSFGVVVLEIVSGKRNTGFYQPEGTLSLLSHAWKLWNDDKALDLMDRVLHETYKRDQVLKCINLALLCVQEDPSDRPTMSNAVLMLSSESATLPVPKKPAFAIRIGDSTTASSSKLESSATLSTTLEQGR